MIKNDKTPAATGVKDEHSQDDLTTKTPPKQARLAAYPQPTTAEEKFIRSYRDKVQAYGEQTGDRRALASAECLTHVLLEGGLRP